MGIGAVACELCLCSVQLSLKDLAIITTPEDFVERRRAEDGFRALQDYGALGDGRTVALSGADGSIDWWCVPNLDSPPLFDRLLDPGAGGFFSLEPSEPYVVERAYRHESNVLESIFTTTSGKVRLVESMNSGSAGRLPWCELARRIEGMEGQVHFDMRLRLGRRADTVSPYLQKIGGHDVFHVGKVLGLILRSDGVMVTAQDDSGMTASIRVAADHTELVAIIAGEDEPLVAPSIAEISARIDSSDEEWRVWARKIDHDGPYRTLLVRSALALKLLLFSPSGAIAAAATTSLPERIGGDKNYDYRYAWIRDAGYTIKAFLRIGAQAEAKAALSWLLNQLEQCGPRVCYSIWGGPAPDARKIEVSGYRGSTPVLVGNVATNQRQHGIYGDIFETASRFVASGNILDSRSAEILSHLADECADVWRLKDSGIWELPEEQHYTMSKISCWQALARAVELADDGHLPTTCRDRWKRECSRVEAWIADHCWSDRLGAYTFYPNTDRLDASIALAVRFRFDGQDRLRRTLEAIDRDLAAGPYHYRYSGADREEGCFLACTFWMIEAWALLGQEDQARAAFDAVIDALDLGVGIYPEMADAQYGHFLGNMPQGLTHLALIQAVSTLSGFSPLCTDAAD